MIIDKPTTQHFKANQRGLITVYRNGNLYLSKPFESESFYLNFPFAGHYQFTGFGFIPTHQTPQVIPPPPFTLPKPERTRVFGVNKILFDDSHSSPARIYTHNGTVVLNSKFNDYTGEIKLFILLHECGHFYYKTEWKCDLYAAYHYLYTYGCNPSNAFDALAGVLKTERADGTTHEENKERIQKIYNLLKSKK